MKILPFILSIFMVISHTSTAQKPLRYLALGDSYTIGEAVPETDRFPVQLVKALKEKNLHFSSPQIIATTGWTTAELSKAIAAQKPLGPFDLVTLLIGVNNQYRGIDKGYTLELYQKEFSDLLQQAIAFAGGDVAKVVVISIPDWGATPFAEGRNRAKVAKEIDEYNAINKSITKKLAICYVDITEHSRLALKDIDLVAHDGLHPSGKMYAYWVNQILKNKF